MKELRTVIRCQLEERYTLHVERETVCKNNLTNRMTRVLKIAIAVSKLRGDAKNIYGFTE